MTFIVSGMSIGLSNPEERRGVYAGLSYKSSMPFTCLHCLVPLSSREKPQI